MNPIAIETLADEVLGAKAAKEYTLLKAKLGGTRSNRVFAFFGVEAPQRVAKAQLIEAEGKKKMKAEAAGVAGGKAKRVSKEVAAARGGKTTGALK